VPDFIVFTDFKHLLIREIVRFAFDYELEILI